MRQLINIESESNAFLGLMEKHLKSRESCGIKIDC